MSDPYPAVRDEGREKKVSPVRGEKREKIRTLSINLHGVIEKGTKSTRRRP